MDQLEAGKTGRRSWSRRLLRLPVALFAVYAGVLIVLMLLENFLVFHPVRAEQDWQPKPTSDTEDVFFTSADGTRIHAWWCPHPDSERALLYCHGNAGNLSHRNGSVRKLRDALGVSVLIFDYPGYGKSEGQPTEKGCYDSAEAAYDWLVGAKMIDPAKVLLYGDSLGGGVAVNLAGRKEHGALVLVRTYTSLPDVGGHVYPWLPVRWVMRNRFDSVGTIGKCCRPVFIAHGTADELIPFALGRGLFDAANEPKLFFEVPGMGHNDPLPDAMFQRLREFLEETGCLACKG